jgi:hypothetical protein
MCQIIPDKKDINLYLFLPFFYQVIYVSLWSNKGPRSHASGLLFMGTREGHDVLVETVDTRIVAANHGIQ